MRKRSTSRGTAIVIALVLVVAMLFTGTFAWQSISQQALNQAIGIPHTDFDAPGGRLHDDFQNMGDNFGQSVWQEGTIANKDVYVENFGQVDIFVRLRLYEYMEFGEGARLHPGQAGFSARAAESMITRPGGTSPDREQSGTWSPFIPGSAETAAFRDYWDWSFGGSKWFMPTFNRDWMSLESDVKGSGVNPQDILPGEQPNTTRRDVDWASVVGVQNPAWIFPSEAGNADFWNPSNPFWAANPGFLNGDGIPTWTAPYKYWNPLTNSHEITTTTYTNVARQTLYAQVVTMDYWVNTLDSAIGNFWVRDTDGWFYWAAPLAPGQATGLLLSDITLHTAPDVEWYYAIFVNAEMATADSWADAWSAPATTPPTADGQTLMNIIAASAFANVPVGATFTDSEGIVWRVIHAEGVDRLIVTEYAFNSPVPYNASNSYTRLTQSDLRGSLNAWGAANLSPELAAIARVPNNVDNDVRVDGSDAQGVNTLGPAGRTTPGAAATNANTALFVLSRTEAIDLIPLPGGGTGAGANPNRVALSVADTTTPQIWWLRSPGNATHPGSVIIANGETSSRAPNNPAAIRPALWIRVGATLPGSDLGPLPDLGSPLGVWLWRGSFGADGLPAWWANRLTYLDFAEDQGVDEIYFAAGLPQMDANPVWAAAVSAFIADAYDRGIAVYYLAGAYEWLRVGNSGLEDRLTMLRAYNNAQVATNTQFAGAHFNIEPHQQTNRYWQWTDGVIGGTLISDLSPEDRIAHRRPIMQRFADLVIEMTDEFSDIPIDWVAAFWWQPGESGAASYRPYMMVEHGPGNNLTPFYEVLMREGRRVIVMSYRTNAGAMMSSSQNYVDFAQSDGRPLVLSALAQAGQDPGTHFAQFADGHSRMVRALAQVREDLTGIPNLGLAVHELRGWHQMWANEQTP